MYVGHNDIHEIGPFGNSATQFFVMGLTLNVHVYYDVLHVI